MGQDLRRWGRGGDDRPVSAPASPERVLAVFEAFLVHARGAPAGVVDTEEGPTDVKINAPRSAVPATIAPIGGSLPSIAPVVNLQSGAVTPVMVRLPVAELPRAITPIDEDDEDEGPSDSEKTKITVMPVAPPDRAEKTAKTEELHPAIDEVGWDGPTQERTEGVQPDTDVALTLPDAPKAIAPMEERSIIVDDDTLTDPEFGPDAMQNVAKMVRTAPVSLVAVDVFAAEMATLIKYGHADQASSEVERWIAAHPSELAAHRDLVGRLRDKYPRELRLHALASRVGA